MRSFSWPACSLLIAAAVAAPAIAADGSSNLLRVVPADAPIVMHVRDLPALVKNWEHTPFAHTWAEPEVQAFLAPAIAKFASEGGAGALADFQEATGMSPLEFAQSFPGELMMVITELPFGSDGDPHFVMAADLGGNRAKVEALIQQAEAKNTVGENETAVEEEFQGEIIHLRVTKNPKSGVTSETEAWAIVDDVFWFGSPKVAVQEAIAHWKGDGAETPITTAQDFAAIRRNHAGAQALFYVNLESIMQLAIADMESDQEEAEAAAAESGEEPPGSPFAMLGMSPAEFVHAFGFDALRGIHFSLSLAEDATSIGGGLTWTEKRGLLKLLAIGEAPAPQPAFISADWPSVSADRFSFAQMIQGLKEAAGEANPMFEFMISQQLTQLNQGLGIDLERDLFGSIGDEIVRAYGATAADADADASTEQLWALSLVNAETFSNALTTIWQLAPQVAAQFQERDYLGTDIQSIMLPIPSGDGMNLVPLAYAITPGYLLLDVGGTAMLETALQNMDKPGESFWSQPKVVAAMKAIPAGSSSFTFQDLNAIVAPALTAFAGLASTAQQAGEEDEDLELDEDGRPIIRPPGEDEDEDSDTPELEELIDPTAVPSAEAVAKHWGTGAGGTYLDADGVRILYRIEHVAE